MSPLISVVMSAYNEEKHLAEAIRSILDQTYQDFEFIIIDDASSDHTWDVMKQFNDPRIVLHQNSENLGLTRSLNIGLRLAKGNLIARMDANDVASSHRFERQVEVLREDEDIDLVWTGADYIDDDGVFLCTKRSPAQHEVIELLLSCNDDFPMGKNHINHISVMFRKDPVLNAGGYSEEYSFGQDGNLWCRLLKSGARFSFIDEPLMAIRLMFDSITSRRLALFSGENDYYYSVCIANRHYQNALKYAFRMPWGFLKIMRIIVTSGRIVIQNAFFR